MATTAPLSNPASSNAAPQAQNQGTERAAEVRGLAAEAKAQARQQMNAGILKASLEISIKAGDESTTLLFRAAIDKINALLEPEFGPDALQGAASTVDASPEATAERILSMSTAFFGAYAQGHAGEPADEVAKNFVELIRGGFEQGFQEAKEILEGLGVFSGEVETGVMKTYELVQKGLDDFLAGLLQPAESEAADEDGA